MIDEDQICYSMLKWCFILVNEMVLLLEFVLCEMCLRFWCYKKLDEFYNFFFQGLRGVYGGGGFVVDLGYIKLLVLRVIYNLQNNFWIDEKMWVVFVEFMIFDLLMNFFSVVLYIFEVLFLGGVIIFERINIMLLYGVRLIGI